VRDDYESFLRDLCASQPCEPKASFSASLIRHFKNKRPAKSSTGSDGIQQRCPNQERHPLIEPGSPKYISFAPQHGSFVGTVAMPSTKEQKTAITRHEKAKADIKYIWKDWEVTTDFRGVTVLYEHAPVDEVQLEYVCGLRNRILGC
jgi:hypothetical protein